MYRVIIFINFVFVNANVRFKPTYVFYLNFNFEL
jgi:hypothetical protein